jgi:hypothetical protein
LCVYREQKLFIEASDWEAKFYQIQSKYLLLLNELHNPQVLMLLVLVIISSCIYIVGYDNNELQSPPGSCVVRYIYEFRYSCWPYKNNELHNFQVPMVMVIISSGIHVVLYNNNELHNPR